LCDSGGFECDNSMQPIMRKIICFSLHEGSINSNTLLNNCLISCSLLLTYKKYKLYLKRKHDCLKLLKGEVIINTKNKQKINICERRMYVCVCVCVCVRVREREQKCTVCTVCERRMSVCKSRRMDFGL